MGFLFSQKGVIDISLEDKDADEAMMDALDAGADVYKRQVFLFSMPQQAHLKRLKNNLPIH